VSLTPRPTRPSLDLVTRRAQTKSRWRGRRGSDRQARRPRTRPSTSSSCSFNGVQASGEVERPSPRSGDAAGPEPVDRARTSRARWPARRRGSEFLRGAPSARPPPDSVSSLGTPISRPPHGGRERPAYATIVLLEPLLHEHLNPANLTTPPERRSRSLWAGTRLVSRSELFRADGDGLRLY
jgi:hypothetical protein